MGGLIFLGITVILLIIGYIVTKISDAIDAKRYLKQNQENDFVKMRQECEQEYQKKQNELAQAQQKCEQTKLCYQKQISEIKLLIEDAAGAYPHMAALTADLMTWHYAQTAGYLDYKPNPAHTAAEAVRKLREETRQIIQEKKILEYETADIRAALDKIHRTFPDLENQTSMANAILRLSFLPPERQRAYTEAFEAERGLRSLSEPMQITGISQIKCSFRSQSGNTYTTTLDSCTCPDFQYRHGICKHMLLLAIRLRTFSFSTTRFQSLVEKYKSEVDTLSEQLRTSKERLKFSKKEQKQHDQWLKQMKMDFPWIAGMLASLEERYDSIRLDTLPKTAYKSAELVKELRKEKKSLQLRAARAEALLATYEHLFPWLEEFRSVPLDEALSVIADTDGDEDYDAQTKKWLSPQEYAKLPTTEKYQLALNRYQNRKKTDWEIGVEYERYIGYLYEQEGYTVKYFGATEGLQDMGRDLIATKGEHALIIQCKRWAENKTIHEKHIFQLYGTTFILQLKDPAHTYTPVFVTTTTLSDIAKECAERLCVEVRAQCAYNDHPLIKCNIGKDEYGAPVRIYHLPFDQQYDRIVIEPEKGECYVKTVDEAEALGFRRAKRHVVE